MHLQTGNYNYNQTIFKYPKITSKLKIKNEEFLSFLDDLEQSQNWREIVENEVKYEVFSEKSIDKYLDKMMKAKQGGTIKQNQQTIMKMKEISQKDREKFNKHFNDYVKTIAINMNKQKKQEQIIKSYQEIYQQKEHQQQQKQNQSEEELLYNIITHHTKIQLDRKDQTQIRNISHQIINLAFQSNHSYQNFQSFINIENKVIIVNDDQKKEKECQNKQQPEEQTENKENIIYDSRFNFDNKQQQEYAEDYYNSIQDYDKIQNKQLREWQLDHIKFKKELKEREEKILKKQKEDQQRISKEVEKNKEQIQKKLDEEDNKQLNIPSDITQYADSFPAQIPIAIVKAIINIILQIVGKFKHICMPVGAAALSTCPEAAGSFANLYSISQLDDKEKTFEMALLNFPKMYFKFQQRFHQFLKQEYKITSSEQAKYLICGQAIFSLTCSQLWSGVDMLAFLFTSDPILTNPLLAFLPPLHYQDIIPGDQPFCFFACIKILVQCLGIFWDEIPDCNATFNLDALIRAASDISQLLYMIFAFVPGFCSYFPFVINMWKLPPLHKRLSQRLKDIRKANIPLITTNISHIELQQQLLKLDQQLYNRDPFAYDFDATKLLRQKQNYPYDVLNFKQEWNAKEWETKYFPQNQLQIEINQNLNKKQVTPDEKQMLIDKAKESYENQKDIITTRETKKQIIQDKIEKLINAYENQDMAGKRSTQDDTPQKYQNQQDEEHLMYDRSSQQ